MISLQLYIFLWILGMLFFLLSFIATGAKRILFNIFAFVFFMILGLIPEVSNSTVLVVNNSIQTATITYQGAYIFQEIAWLLMAVCIIRFIQHAFMTFRLAGGGE